MVAPVVKVAEAEGHLYMNPETNKPYENRIANEKAIVFDKNDFLKALEMSDIEESKLLLQRINTLFNN
jgi:hypothetical protein